MQRNLKIAATFKNFLTCDGDTVVIDIKEHLTNAVLNNFCINDQYNNS